MTDCTLPALSSAALLAFFQLVFAAFRHAVITEHHHLPVPQIDSAQRLRIFDPDRFRATGIAAHDVGAFTALVRDDLVVLAAEHDRGATAIDRHQDITGLECQSACEIDFFTSFFKWGGNFRPLSRVSRGLIQPRQ